MDSYPNFELKKWLEIDRSIAFYREYLKLKKIPLEKIKNMFFLFSRFNEFLEKEKLNIYLVVLIWDAILFEVAKKYNCQWLSVRNSRISQGIIL